MSNQKRNEKLANDIKKFIMSNKLNQDVRIYFNNKCYDFCDGGEPKVIEDIKATSYFEYGNDETVSMSFEGRLNHILNYGESRSIESKFNKIFEKHKCYFEFGYAWSLSVYFD